MMLYLKADGATVIKYPYTQADLQADNPNTTFEVPVSEDTYVHFGASVVTEVPAPEYDPITSNCTELTPTLVSGVWTQTWEVTPASPEEVNARMLQQYNDTKSQLAKYYDQQAQVSGFADRNACVARAGYAGTYQAHGEAFGVWMDACNEIAAAEPQPFPPVGDIIAKFPVLVMPYNPTPFAP